MMNVELLSFERASKCHPYESNHVTSLEKDLDYARELTFHPEALQSGVSYARQGASVNNKSHLHLLKFGGHGVGICAC